MLLREGYSLEEIDKMTPFEMSYILAGLLVESDRIKKGMDKAKRGRRGGRIR